MTLAELETLVWKRLPVRKFMVGKQAIRDMVQIAVADWNPEVVQNCNGETELDIVASAMVANIKRVYQAAGQYEEHGMEYGFLWVLLLQALASAVVQILLRWWFDSTDNKTAMLSLRRELSE